MQFRYSFYSILYYKFLLGVRPSLDLRQIACRLFHINASGFHRGGKYNLR